MPAKPSAGAVRVVTTISKEHYPRWCPEFKECLALIIDRETGIGEAREALREILASAKPRALEHPTMFAAWIRGERALAKLEA